MYFQRACDAGDKEACSETGLKRISGIDSTPLLVVLCYLYSFYENVVSRAVKLQATEQLEDGGQKQRANMSTWNYSKYWTIF